jgi:hypothetical protein
LYIGFMRTTVNVSSIFDLPNIWHGWLFSHDAIGPPSKELWFDESEDEPFVDEQAKFNAAMVKVARPAAGPR